MPAPLRPQDWQVEHALVEQQVPSTQLPLVHWLVAEHASPRDFFAVQVVPEQKLPAAQSRSVEQAVKQAPAPLQV